MIQVGGNFGHKEACPLCKTDNNDQKYLLECTALKLPDLTQIQYNYIYEEDSSKVIQISKLLHDSYKKREIILDKP